MVCAAQVTSARVYKCSLFSFLSLVLELTLKGGYVNEEKRITNMGRNKQVVCQKCCRVMRSDHLNRHMKLHEKLHENSLDSIYSSRAS